MEQAGSGRDKAAFPSPDGRCHCGIISAIRRENPMSWRRRIQHSIFKNGEGWARC